MASVLQNVTAGTGNGGQMLTFLSRWWGEKVGEEAAAQLRAQPTLARFAHCSGELRSPALRLVGAAEDRDISVAAPAVHVGASAFVAGQGARIYSLDVFRRDRSTPRRPPRAA